MMHKSAKPSNINNSARCTYYFPNGTRCRLIGFAGQAFCPRHTPAAAPPHEPAYPSSAEVAATLTDVLLRPIIETHRNGGSRS